MEDAIIKSAELMVLSWYLPSSARFLLRGFSSPGGGPFLSTLPVLLFAFLLDSVIGRDKVSFLIGHFAQGEVHA